MSDNASWPGAIKGVVGTCLWTINGFWIEVGSHQAEVGWWHTAYARLGNGNGNENG